MTQLSSEPGANREQDTNELRSLAERCERATGSDRELDELIGAAIAEAVREVQPDGRSAYHSADGARWVSVQVPEPGYTASLDVAMTLVPDNCLVMVKQLWNADGKSTLARLDRYGKSMWTGDFNGLSDYAPLALCAAALRARAA